MAPKRKAAKQGVKLANADKKQLVQDVITDSQPTLSQVVEQAVKAAFPDETTEMPPVTPQVASPTCSTGCDCENKTKQICKTFRTSQ